MPHSLDQTVLRYVSFIETAVSGKYEELSSAKLNEIVTEVVKETSPAKDYDATVGMVTPILSAEDDIRNQVVTLALLERFATNIDLTAAPLIRLHEIVYSESVVRSRRTTKEVADFPGRLPTCPSETVARFDELQAMVRSIAEIERPSAEAQAQLLAHVFSGVIRIHFFKDGNGRAARFSAQYLLKRWDGDFINIPKVRNDVVWKSALDTAIAGDPEALSKEFLLRVKRESD